MAMPFRTLPDEMTHRNSTRAGYPLPLARGRGQDERTSFATE
jgi:hypothetical protein